MTKAEFITKVQENMTTEEVTVTKKATAAWVDGVINTIADCLMAGEKVSFTGFGSFEVIEKPEAERRNPATGEYFTAPAHKAPKFKYANSFKQTIKGV